MANTVPTGFDSPTVASKNLSRLLSRLDQKLRSGGSSTTPLERAKIAAVGSSEYPDRYGYSLS
jgi:hypothetical protein